MQKSSHMAGFLFHDLFGNFLRRNKKPSRLAGFFAV
jgi:hypothetical protein